MLWNSASAGQTASFKLLREASEPLGIELQPIDLRGRDGLAGVSGSLAKAKAQGMIVLSDRPGFGVELDEERLKATRPTIRVLYLSGYTDAVVTRKGLLEGGAAFLEKPFTSESLAQRVREVLDVGAD